LNPLANSDQQQRDFVSRDGYHRLVIADTDIAISDVAGSRKLLAAVERAITQTVPAGITATVVSGHQYALANAQTVQSDIKVVLGTATGAILLIFILLLRSWRALFVFLLPASVLGISAAAVASVFPVVSGITIGFGAVLLGITVDFTLHVYFALRGSKQPQEQLRRLTAPLLGSALTSFLAFSVLLSSALPEQRQLAVFSLSAIVLALLLAVVVMPHLCGNATLGSMVAFPAKTSGQKLVLKRQRSQAVVVILWMSVLALCAIAVPRLNFDGDLRSLSVATSSLQDNEQMVKQVWGNMRTSALLFARGKDLDSALAVNDEIYKVVRPDNREAGQDTHHPKLVSVAAILPSAASQAHSRELWREFWQVQRPLLVGRLAQSGAELGFSESAFQPFIHWLDQPVVPIELQAWQQGGLTTLLSDLIISDNSSGGIDNPGFAVLSLLDEADLTVQLQRDLVAVSGAIVVAQGIFRQQLSSELAKDFSNFIFMAFGAVVLVLTCWYRRWRYVLLALLPVASGLLFMFGIMAWLGLSFNLFNVIAAILIIGLGVDYAIFMLSRCDGSGCRQSERAVLVSALTTLAGFGSLVLAQHPAMYSIGISVMLGISSAAVSALLVVPICYAWLMPKGELK
jgi:predicted exporter